MEENIIINENLAVYEAMKMLKLPVNTLPPIALKYLKNLSSRIGMCIEVCLTAYATYNQIMLNMPCNDDLYIVPDSERQWFVDKGYCK